MGNAARSWVDRFEWHPLTSKQKRQLVFGRDPRDFTRLVLLAYFPFPTPQTADGRYSISKGFAQFCQWAKWAVLGSAVPLYFHWLAAICALPRLFGSSAEINATPVGYFIDTRLLQLDQDPWYVFGGTLFAWAQAQWTLRTLMSIYFHLRPAAEKTQRRTSDPL